MSVKAKIPFGQGQKDAELISVREANEPWAEYQLIDGTTLRVKSVVTEIWKVEGEYDADGNPAYALKSQLLTAVISPEHMKRRK